MYRLSYVTVSIQSRHPHHICLLPQFRTFRYRSILTKRIRKVRSIDQWFMLTHLVKLWTFIAYCFIVSFIAIFYLFYMNRLIARMIFFVIRIYTWRKYKAWVELGSLDLLVIRRWYFRIDHIYALGWTSHVSKLSILLKKSVYSCLARLYYF